MKKILITMGDPSGIGPEVTVKCLARIAAAATGTTTGALTSTAASTTTRAATSTKFTTATAFASVHDFQPVVVGERDILTETAKYLDLKVEFGPEDSPRPGRIGVRSLDLLRSGDFEMGKVSALCGNAAYHYFTHAVESCLAGDAAAIVTAPLHKEAMNLAGHHYVGHTDILEKMTGAETIIMALVTPQIMVSHVTDHLPLRKALDAITIPRIKAVVKLTWKSLLARGVSSPRIALAGVNPHAGENGLFGREEIEILKPAMEQLKAEGYPCHGPLPGDTVFLEALRGRYDGVLAMYHDQGFGPMKTVDFAHGVNCTLGLPFVRTSPDHGTAHGIAGKGVADEESMVSAWDLAVKLLRSRT